MLQTIQMFEITELSEHVDTEMMPLPRNQWRYIMALNKKKALGNRLEQVKLYTIYPGLEAICIIPKQMREKYNSLVVEELFETLEHNIYNLDEGETEYDIPWIDARAPYAIFFYHYYEE
jgi:hypothetical protein